MLANLLPYTMASVPYGTHISVFASSLTSTQSQSKPVSGGATGQDSDISQRMSSPRRHTEFVNGHRQGPQTVNGRRQGPQTVNGVHRRSTGSTDGQRTPTGSTDGQHDPRTTRLQVSDDMQPTDSHQANRQMVTRPRANQH